VLGDGLVGGAFIPRPGCLDGREFSDGSLGLQPLEYLMKGQPIYGYRLSVSTDRKKLTIRSIDPKTLADLTSIVVFDRVAD
jgi:hypothetical protein